ncbi:uncharacterized protein LOC143072629 [Mytilus galloprovincialis]|uniref:uncharacterized protein LOC143072629 n=1 Tax=Mytilus galloprovincialis TaxID=29158 RepID=UPI003F7C3B0D
MSKEKANQLKEEGNKCVKEGNYAEAVLHYTHAIGQDGRNHVLYSNRSLCFLKLHQYYYAMEDAKESIKLKSDWPKGFFRKGEVEFAVGNYTLAMMAYKQAELIDPTDQGIKVAMLKTTKEVIRVRKEERRQPWLYGGGGLLIGFIIVLADQFLTDKPSIQNIVLQILLIILFGGMGLLVLKTYRFVIESQQSSLLEEPVDLMKAMNGEDDLPETSSTETKETDKKPHRKGGVGSARQRYKMGKS